MIKATGAIWSQAASKVYGKCIFPSSGSSGGGVVLEQTEALQAVWPRGQRSGVGGHTMASRDLRTMSFFERLGPFV